MIEVAGFRRPLRAGLAVGVILALTPAAPALADARAGAAVFKRDCAVCHSEGAYYIKPDMFPENGSKANEGLIH